MRNPLTKTWRTLAQQEGGIVMVGSQGVVTLIYRNPATGEEVRWSVPLPASPAMLRTIERAFAEKGFVRGEDEASS